MHWRPITWQDEAPVTKYNPIRPETALGLHGDRRRIRFVLRPYETTQAHPVSRLLWFLPLLYPGSQAWLDRRLEDVILGRARCTLAYTTSGLVGLTIETPKGLRRVKLSTIYVDPKYRGLGIGTALLKNCVGHWKRSRIERAHVTVAAHREPTLAPLLQSSQFQLAGVQENRYGFDRDEAIYIWQR